MISVDEAIARISRAFAPLGSETAPIGEAAGRVLAEDAVARMDQPPAPMSAMDGYAVRTASASAGAELAVLAREQRDDAIGLAVIDDPEDQRWRDELLHDWPRQ